MAGHGHSNAVVGLYDRGARTTRQQAQQLDACSNHSAEGHMTVDDVLLQDPIARAMKPKQQGTVASESGARFLADIAERHTNIDFCGQKGRVGRRRGENAHFVSGFRRVISEIDGNALATSLPQLRQGMHDPQSPAGNRFHGCSSVVRLFGEDSCHSLHARSVVQVCRWGDGFVAIWLCGGSSHAQQLVVLLALVLVEALRIHHVDRPLPQTLSHPASMRRVLH